VFFLDVGRHEVPDTVLDLRPPAERRCSMSFLHSSSLVGSLIRVQCFPLAALKLRHALTPHHVRRTLPQHQARVLRGWGLFNLDGSEAPARRASTPLCLD